MRPELNWYGWSTETIAAVYESDMAAKEAEQGLINKDYAWSAFRAEQIEQEMDETCAS